MTTRHSPLSALKKQADTIAASLKAAARKGHTEPSVRFAVVMDDQTISIEMPWATICETDEAGIAEFILREMRGGRNDG